MRIVLAVLIAVGACILYLAEQDRPHPALVVAAGVAVWVVALGGLATAVDSAIQSHRVKRLDEMRAPIAMRVLALRYEIAEITHIDRNALGISVYLVRPHFRWFAPRLRPVYEDRRTVRRVRSGIRWRVGKGVIGLCVQESREVTVDTREVFEEFEADGDSSWMLRSHNDRMGLSSKEMRLAGTKYSVVFAVPIFRGSRTVGCIGLDAPPGSKPLVRQKAARLAMNSAATAIEGILEK